MIKTTKYKLKLHVLPSHLVIFTNTMNKKYSAIICRPKSVGNRCEIKISLLRNLIFKKNQFFLFDFFNLFLAFFNHAEEEKIIISKFQDRDAELAQNYPYIINLFYCLFRNFY